MSQPAVVGGGLPLPSGPSRSRLPGDVHNKRQKLAQVGIQDITARTAAGVAQLEDEVGDPHWNVVV